MRQHTRHLLRVLRTDGRQQVILCLVDRDDAVQCIAAGAVHAIEFGSIVKQVLGGIFGLFRVLPAIIVANAFQVPDSKRERDSAVVDQLPHGALCLLRIPWCNFPWFKIRLQVLLAYMFVGLAGVIGCAAQPRKILRIVEEELRCGFCGRIGIGIGRKLLEIVHRQPIVEHCA